MTVPPADLEFPYSAGVDELVSRSLAEDIGAGDATTEVAVPAGLLARARLVAREPGIIAGLPLLPLLFGQLSAEVKIEFEVSDGASVAAGALVAGLLGPARAVLSGERVALNFLQHLSGIASLTASYVQAVSGTDCRILDTRKTVPGFRALAKYAVRAGGGYNHRLGLFDRILFKDNHWVATGGQLEELVAVARKRYPSLAIEVEVDSPEQLERVLPLGVEWILLDNFTPAAVREAVTRRDRVAERRRTLLEASGNIDLGNVRKYADAGVDAVSIGRLTHSAPAMDLALDLTLTPRDPDGCAGPTAGDGT